MFPVGFQLRRVGCFEPATVMETWVIDAPAALTNTTLFRLSRLLWPAAAEDAIEMFTKAAADKVQCDRVDARIDES